MPLAVSGLIELIFLLLLALDDEPNWLYRIHEKAWRNYIKRPFLFLARGKYGEDISPHSFTKYIPEDWALLESIITKKLPEHTQKTS